MKGALTGVTRLSSKAKCAILLLGLMVLGFIVFSMASMDQNAHSVDSNRPGGSDRSAGKTVAPAKRSRARRKEDQRQQSAIRAALEMRAGQSGASASNVEALRESSDLNPLRRAQSDRIAAALDAAAQAARAAQNPAFPLDAASVLQDTDPNQQEHKEQFLRSKSVLPKIYLSAKKQHP